MRFWNLLISHVTGSPPMEVSFSTPNNNDNPNSDGNDGDKSHDAPNVEIFSQRQARGVIIPVHIAPPFSDPSFSPSSSDLEIPPPTPVDRYELSSALHDEQHHPLFENNMATESSPIRLRNDDLLLASLSKERLALLTHYARLCSHIYWPEPERVEKEFRKEVLDRVAHRQGFIQSIAVRDLERGTVRYAVFSVVEEIHDREHPLLENPNHNHDDGVDRDQFLNGHQQQEQPHAQQHDWVHVSTPAIQYICIRGTINLHNLFVDFQISTASDEGINITGKQTQQDKSDDIRFHRGWLRIAHLIVEDFSSPQAPVHLNKDLPIVIIGHSLGGAVAVILALHLRSEGFDVAEVVTFGQPRISPLQSAETLKEYFDEITDPCFSHQTTSPTSERSRKRIPLLRIINECDPIPVLPPFRLFAYTQFGPQMTLVSKSSPHNDRATNNAPHEEGPFAVGIPSSGGVDAEDPTMAAHDIPTPHSVPHNAISRAGLLEHLFKRAAPQPNATTTLTTTTTTTHSITSTETIIPVQSDLSPEAITAVSQTTNTVIEKTMMWGDTMWWISWILGREHHVDVYITRLEALEANSSSETRL